IRSKGASRFFGSFCRMIRPAEEDGAVLSRWRLRKASISISSSACEFFDPSAVPLELKARFVPVQIGQRQPVAACVPRALPAKGLPNSVGMPWIVGTPVWVVGHEVVLGTVDTDGVEGGVMPLRGVSRPTAGADGLGFSTTDGGLRPPPPISVEPSGMPTGPTDEPGPIDEASGADAIADAAHVPATVAAVPPPSNGAVPDDPVMALAVAVSAPVVEVAA